MFRRIKVLQSLINVRHKGVKIIQIELEKISKADQLKKLYFESKHLYGAKLNKKSLEKKKKVKPLEVEEKDHDVKSQIKSDKDLSSEIYWTCLHVPEVQDFTNPKKKSKTKKNEDKIEDFDEQKVKKRKKKVKIEVSNVSAEEIESPGSPVIAAPFVPLPLVNAAPVPAVPMPAPAEKTTKKATKNIVIIPQLPFSLTQLSSALPPSTATNKSSSSDSESDASSDESFKEREIPFEKQQLREITSFPLILKNNKIISTFESFVPTKSSVYIPSVSKVLQGTMPESQRAALVKWKSLKITELGLDGFNIMQQSHLSRGKQFHESLQNYFKGESVDKTDLPSEVLEIWNSIEPLLGKFAAPGVLIEEKVKHPYLLYQGVVDCVSFHNSTLSVIEWKKSDRQKKSLSFTYDAPIQLCSYLGALNASREEFRENPIKSGVIVVAYNDGQKADLFELNESDLKKYWKLWLHRLQEYWVRYRDNTLPEQI